MLDERLRDLSVYRLNKAKEEFATSRELFDNSRYSQAVNRSYYSIFHAVRALLAIEQVDFKKHSGVIAYFQQNYIKNGKLDKSLSDIILSANTIRNNSDYNDFFVVSKEEAIKQIHQAEKFIDNIEKYLNHIY